MNDPIPTRTFCSCEVLREIGHGAYGTVYLARRGDEYVALKICRKPTEGDSAGFDREKRGILATRRIPPHSTLVRILDFEEAEDGTAFAYAMELADDELTGRRIDPASYRPKTLSSVLAAEVALRIRPCLRLAHRLSVALEHLQSHHLLHRDIKPGNVIYVNGKPVLADFGLVRDAREAVSIVGTPGYEPPEHHGTPQGDVYSLGQTLYRASTGHDPSEKGFSPCAEADVDSPIFWRWMVVVEKACSPILSRRYRSAKAMRKAIARLSVAERMYRYRFVRYVFGGLVLAVIAFLFWCVPYAAQLDTWLSNGPEWRYHTKPHGPMLLLSPFLRPKTDPMDKKAPHYALFHERTPIVRIDLPEFETPTNPPPSVSVPNVPAIEPPIEETNSPPVSLAVEEVPEAPRRDDAVADETLRTKDEPDETASDGNAGPEEKPLAENAGGEPIPVDEEDDPRPVRDDLFALRSLLGEEVGVSLETRVFGVQGVEWVSNVLDRILKAEPPEMPSDEAIRPILLSIRPDRSKAIDFDGDGVSNEYETPQVRLMDSEVPWFRPDFPAEEISGKPLSHGFWPVALPGTFQMGGVSYTNLYVSPEGFVVFGNPYLPPPHSDAVPGANDLFQNPPDLEHPIFRVYPKALKRSNGTSKTRSKVFFFEGVLRHCHVGILEFRNFFTDSVGRGQVSPVSFQVVLPLMVPNLVIVHFADPGMQPRCEGLEDPVGLIGPNRRYVLHRKANLSPTHAKGSGKTVFYYSGMGSSSVRFDTDGDGLSDGAEFFVDTDPGNADTDRDGLPDRWEVENGLDPLDPNGDEGPAGDPDGDGISNLEEFRRHTDPLKRE